MAGMSILSSVESNKQAEANARSRAAFLLQNFKVQENNIVETGKELNRQIGMELTNVRFEGLKAQASTSNAIVEKEIAGATAARLYNDSGIKETMISNQLKQKSESNLSDLYSNLMTNKLSYESGMMDSTTQFYNQLQSPLEITSKAVSAGLSGASMAKGL